MPPPLAVAELAPDGGRRTVDELSDVGVAVLLARVCVAAARLVCAAAPISELVGLAPLAACLDSVADEGTRVSDLFVVASCAADEFARVCLVVVVVVVVVVLVVDDGAARLTVVETVLVPLAIPEATVVEALRV